MSDGVELYGFLINLGLPDGMWAVGGSGVMHLREMRGVRPLGDVDLFVTASLYRRLQVSQEWEERRPREDDPPFLELTRTDHLYHEPPAGPDGAPVPVHAFCAWSTRRFLFDVPWAIHHAEHVDGIPCIPLQYVYHLKWLKSGLNGDEESDPKHLSDLDVLDDYMMGVVGVEWRPHLR